MTKKISEKVFDKLVSMGLSPVSIPKRIMTGHWQRSAGAWRWSCWNDAHLEIGSCETMKDFIEAEEVSILYHNLDTEIIVEKYNKRKVL